MNERRHYLSDYDDIIASHPSLETVFNYIHRVAPQRPCAQFIDDNGRQTVTYLEQSQLTAKVASVIAEEFSNLPAESWVALKIQNGPMWLTFFWGTLMAGYNVLLIDALMNADATEKLLNEAGVSAAIFSDCLKPPGCPVLYTENILRKAKANTYDSPKSWGTHFALCTSGTTATPRIYTYDGSSFAHIIRALISISIFNTRRGDRVLAMLPFHHVLGLCSILTYMSVGATIIYPKDKAPSTLLATCKEYRVNVIVTVPLFWHGVHKALDRQLMVKGPGLKAAIDRLLSVGIGIQTVFGRFGAAFCRKILFRSVTSKLFGTGFLFGVTGGGHISPATLRLLNGLGYRFVNGYGMTEIAASHICTVGWLRTALSGSIGTPALGYAASVLVKDGDKESIASEGHGELLVKGEPLHNGILKNGTILTPERYKDGWFRTGDIVTITNGNTFIEGRVKEVIVPSSGENVYPDEIEEHFASLPQSEQMTILGLPGEFNNDDISLVVRIPEEISELPPTEMVSVFHRLNDELPINKRVNRLLATRQPIPLSASLKTKRLELRRLITEGSFEYVEVPIKAQLSRMIPKLNAVHRDNTEFDAVKIEIRAALAGITGFIPSAFTDSTPIMSGLDIDSLGATELLVFAENKYGIRIPQEDVITTQATINSIAEMLIDKGSTPSKDNALRSKAGGHPLNLLQCPASMPLYMPDAANLPDHLFAEYVNPCVADLTRKLRLDKVFVKGERHFLYDSDGNKYLDCIASYGALPFGHNPQEIWEALHAVEEKSEPNFVQPSLLDAAGRLAERLISIAPGPMKYVTFANSGAEAVEAGIKMARAATGRTGIVAAVNSFHGKTLGALSATGKSMYQQAFGAPVPGFSFVPYGNIGALAKILEDGGDNIAAFIVEPIQGEGGVVVPPPGYLSQVRQLCNKYGVLLILDEIQTGLGRTGTIFACESEGVEPDILLVAKALGGGLVPIGACIASEKAYTAEFGLRHSSTFAGNTLACRVGLRVLELLESGGRSIVKDVASNGEYIRGKLLALKEAYPDVIAEVRGRGYLLGIKFAVNHETFPDSLLGIMGSQDLIAPVVASYLLNRHGIRVAPTLNGGSVVRIEPSLTFTQEECDMLIAGIGAVVKLIREKNSVELIGHIFDWPIKAEEQNLDSPVDMRKPKSLTAGNDIAPTRFAFLLHPLDITDYVKFDPSLGALSHSQLQELADYCASSMEPSVIASTTVSVSGRSATGEFILIPKTADQFVHTAPDRMIDELKYAVSLARDRGAQIVGLGAYTSVVTGGGSELLTEGVPLTSGNSYTVVSAIDALTETCSQLGINMAESGACVVGATGSIGQGCTHLLSGLVNRLSLVGSNRQASQARLSHLAVDLCKYWSMINENGDADSIPKGTVGSTITSNPKLPKANANYHEFIEFIEGELLGSKNPILRFGDIDTDLPSTELIVCATSNPNRIVYPHHLRQGAVVCDLSRPGNVSQDVVSKRRDVLVIDGGIIQVPGRPDLGMNLGLGKGNAYACMCETIMLALAGHCENTSVGATGVAMDTIRLVKDLSRKLGFQLASLKSFDLPVTDVRWQELREIRAEKARVAKVRNA